MDKTKNQELLIQNIISEVVTFIAEEQNVSVERALEIFYSTEVATKLEDLDTGYYLEGARYIYEIVKEELIKMHIIRDDNPILRQKSQEVEEVTIEDKKLIDDMHSTMKVANAFGIAAVQVGVLKRIIVVEHEDKILKLINPKIVSTSGKQKFLESCLSIDKENEHTGGWVERPYKIKVNALNENGEETNIEAEGMLAVILCHEIDHLDGILYIDKIDGQLEQFNSSEERKEYRKENPLVIIAVKDI